MSLIAKAKSFLKRAEKSEEVEKLPRSQLEPKTDAKKQDSINQIKDIYIGLDFGTTFTKVAYEIPSTKYIKYSVKFSQAADDSCYYKESILYFNAQNQTLSVSKTSESDTDVRYFKYSMVSDSLPKNAVLHTYENELKNNVEQLCSAFFLSHVISHSKKFISENPAIKNRLANLNWHINMGVPVTENGEADSIYKTVLFVANAYSEKFPESDTVSLLDFDNFFTENKNIENPYCNTLPELYAEILLYQQDNAIPSGFYSVVDVGGGTVDIATFLKTVDTTGNNGTKVECISQSIESLGFDSLAAKIVSERSENTISHTKEILQQKHIDYYSLDESSGIRKFLAEDFIDLEKFYECIKSFRTSYGTCLTKARDKQYYLMHKQLEAEQPMKYFLVGGACKVPFYEKNMERMINAHTKAGIPTAVKENILNYLNHNFTLEVKNNPRLLISQMLAQPYERIPPLDNMPWHIPVNPPNNKPKEDPKEKLDEIQKEKYGEC